MRLQLLLLSGTETKSTEEKKVKHLEAPKTADEREGPKVKIKSEEQNI